MHARFSQNSDWAISDFQISGQSLVITKEKVMMLT